MENLDAPQKVNLSEDASIDPNAHVFSESIESFYLAADEEIELIIQEAMDSQYSKGNFSNLPGQKWRVCIIESCVSDNRNWYRPEILKSRLNLFEASPGRIYKFDGRTKNSNMPHNDHVPNHIAARNAGTVTGNTCCVYSNVKFESIPSSRILGAPLVPAVTADATFIDNRTREKLWESYKAGFQNGNRNDLFQISIEAEGPHSVIFHEGRQVNRVDDITNFREGTIVRRGAAGGLFLYPYPVATQESKIESNNKKEIEQTFDKTNAKSVRQDLSVPVQAAAAVKTEAIGLVTAMSNDDTKKGRDVPAEDAKTAIQILRTGNLELGIETLETAMDGDGEDADGCDADDDADDGAESQKTTKKAVKSPAMKKESEKSDQLNEGTEQKTVSINNQQTEPQNAGSVQNSNNATNANVSDIAVYMTKLQESESRVATLENEIGDFVNFISAKDAAQEARFAEALGTIETLRESDNARRQEDALKESRRQLAARLKESGLPKATQTVIAEEFDGVLFESERLDSRIESHRNHLLKMTEAMGIHKESQNRNSAVPGVAGYSHLNLQMGGNRIDFVQKELDLAFGYVPTLAESQNEYKGHSKQLSIKRPICMWHDDSEWTGNGYVGQNAILHEAVSTDTGLANLLQNSMTKSLMQRYMSQPALWREVAQVSPAANFLEHQVMVMGGLGILPQVVESGTGTTYLSLGFPSTSQVTFNVGTFGGLIKVTRQAIINDNLQGIQRFPQEAAESAIMTLNLQVFGTMIGKYGYQSSGAINTANSYDGYDIYHNNHFNTSTAALGYQSLVDMLIRARNQRRFANVGVVGNGGVISIGDSVFSVTSANDFAGSIKAGDKLRIHAEEVTVLSVATLAITIVGTFAAAHADGARVEQLGSPIATDSAKLIIPTELEAQAYQLLASALVPGSTTNDANFLFPAYQNKSLVPLPMHAMYLGDDLTNFYMALGKPVMSMFLGGREEPELALQDNPLVGNVFTGDQIAWKVRHEHGHVLPEHRQVQGNIVA